MNFKTGTDKLNIVVVYRYLKNFYLQDNEMDLELTKYMKLLTNPVYLLSCFDLYFKKCIVLVEAINHNWNNFCQERMFSFCSALSHEMGI